MEGLNDSAVTRYLTRLGATVCLLFVVLVVASPALADPQIYTANGTYENPRGCNQNPFSSFFNVLVDPAKQRNNMQIDQPSTGDSVKGTVNPNGKFHLNNAEEDYRGTADGKTLEGTYTWTYNGCTAKWFFTLELDRAMALPQAAAAEPEPDEETDVGGAANTEEEEPEQPPAAQPVSGTEDSGGLPPFIWIGLAGGAAAGGLVAYNALKKKDDEAEGVTAPGPTLSKPWSGVVFRGPPQSFAGLPVEDGEATTSEAGVSRASIARLRGFEEVPAVSTGGRFDPNIEDDNFLEGTDEAATNKPAGNDGSKVVEQQPRDVSSLKRKPEPERMMCCKSCGYAGSYAEFYSFRKDDNCPKCSSMEVRTLTAEELEAKALAEVLDPTTDKK
jgi:hypothetical protein